MHVNHIASACHATTGPPLGRAQHHLSAPPGLTMVLSLTICGPQEVIEL